MEYFATVDLCHMYWLFPSDENSQECQSFITPDDVYTPTRVLQGQRNAVTYCQSTMQQICQEIIDRLLGWLDDMLFYARTIDGLLETLRLFFLICRKHNLKIHAEKCDFFLRKVQWCGRIVSAEGVQMNPRKLNALLELQEPQNAADLQQFLCAANWMRSCIPEFSKLTEDLSNLLESIYRKAGKRTRRAVAKFILTEHGWCRIVDLALFASRSVVAQRPLLGSALLVAPFGSSS